MKALVFVSLAAALEHMKGQGRGQKHKTKQSPTSEHETKKKKDLCGRASMKLPYIVTARVGTHSRAAYLITEPRITQFKQHLSFFALSSPSLPPQSSGDSEDKQANRHADRKPLSPSLVCVC